MKLEKFTIFSLKCNLKFYGSQSRIQVASLPCPKLDASDLQLSPGKFCGAHIIFAESKIHTSTDILILMHAQLQRDDY